MWRPDTTISLGQVKCNITILVIGCLRDTEFLIYIFQSQNANDVMQKLTLDEEAEMELDYLATMFPGMSDQSLADVYNASGGDMEASIEMLNQLESHLPNFITNFQTLWTLVT